MRKDGSSIYAGDNHLGVGAGNAGGELEFNFNSDSLGRCFSGISAQRKQQISHQN
jgi:hypothetical protein